MVSTIGSVQCQTTGIYSIDSLAENVECNIYLFESGNYYIELSENVTSDIVESLVLSYGIFSQEKSEISLIDKVHNYKMVLVIDNNILIIKKSFSFLKNKKFIFNSFVTIREPKFLNSDMDFLMLEKERQFHNESNKPLAPIDFGVYGNCKGFELIIQKNNKYILEFKNLILSEGEWCRNYNEIELMDVSLKHSFFVLVEGNSLISKLLPGEYKSCFLLKIE